VRERKASDWIPASIGMTKSEAEMTEKPGRANPGEKNNWRYTKIIYKIIPLIYNR